MTVVFILAAWTPAAHAVQPTIRLGVPPNGWPPYVIVREGHIDGIAVDMAREIATRLGYSIVFTRCPKKRGHLKVDTDQLDAWFDAREWSDTPDRYLWSEPMVTAMDYLVFRRQCPLDYGQPADLYGKAIGTHLGYHYPALESHFANGHMTRRDALSERAMLKMLSLGRTDAAIMNKYVARWVIKNDDRLCPSQFTFSMQKIDCAGYRIMFTRQRDWAPFIERFNLELEQMKTDGRSQAIIARYQ